MHRHAGLDPASRRVLETLDVPARFGWLRLPSVARLEFTPYWIRGRNDNP